MAAAIAAVGATLLGVAAWVIHGYFYDASFMRADLGYSNATVNTCTTGETLYFGYTFMPTRDVHLTGAELVGVPATFTVQGIYAVDRARSGQGVFIGGTQANWDHDGYSGTRLHPVTDVNLPVGGMGGWWLVAKVVPHATGTQTIQGIRVFYTSGSRSGSTVYDQQAASDCAH
jgi:hypothetical protein